VVLLNSIGVSHICEHNVFTIDTAVFLTIFNVSDKSVVDTEGVDPTPCHVDIPPLDAHHVETHPERLFIKSSFVKCAAAIS